MMSPWLRNGSEKREPPVIFVEINEEFQESIPGNLIQQAAQQTLQLNKLEESPSLSIKISTDQEIRQLNATYRGLDKVTDVLSFTADYIDPDLETRYLGDVVISFPRAARQAEQRGHSPQAEVQLLVVHGVLHLLGFDHDTFEAKRDMWGIQERIMQALGLNIQVEDEDTF